MSMQKELFKQLFRRAFTNRFPVKHIPRSVTGFLKNVENGKAKASEPVPVPPKFRGRVEYHKGKCIGCRLCVKVCPPRAMEVHY